MANVDRRATLPLMLNFRTFFVALAWMAVPNIAVLQPTSRDEMQSAVDACIRTPPTGTPAATTMSYPIDLGKGQPAIEDLPVSVSALCLVLGMIQSSLQFNRAALDL